MTSGLDRRDFFLAAGATAASATAASVAAAAPARLLTSVTASTHIATVSGPASEIPLIGDVPANLLRRITALCGDAPIAAAPLAIHVDIGFSQSGPRALDVFAGVPFGLSPVACEEWLTVAGGAVLLADTAAEVGLMAFHLGNLGAFPGLWSKTELSSVDDLRGATIACRGLAADLAAAVGARPLGPGESVAIREGLTPVVDLVAGVAETLPWFAAPGLTTGGFNLIATVDIDAWHRLDDTSKARIEAAIAIEAARLTVAADASIAPARAAIARLHSGGHGGTRPFDLGSIEVLATLARDVANDLLRTTPAGSELADSYFGFSTSRSGGAMPPLVG